MAVPVRIFTQARGALEATAGTFLTPTRTLYGEEFTWEQTIAPIRPETLTGTYFGWPSASAGVETNTWGWNGRADFESLVTLFNLFIAPLGTASGTASGGSAWSWAFVPSGTADNLKTLSIQTGDTQGIATSPGAQLSYVKGNTLNLHWEKNDDGGVPFTASFMTAGTATSITAFTGSPTNVAGTPLSAIGTKVYLDATTIGSTLDTTVISVDWTLDLQPVPLYTLTGSAGATSVQRPNHRPWTATIVRQYANATERAIYGTKAERKVSIVTTGPALGTATQLATVNLYGVYDGPYGFSNVDGIITESLTLVPFTDTGVSRDFDATVVTSFGTVT